MENYKELLESHGIAFQLQVRLSKLHATAAERSPEKLKPQLKLNSNILSGAPKTKKSEVKIGRRLEEISSKNNDNKLLILNGITSHIRIHIKRLKVPPLVNKFSPRNSRKAACKTRAEKLYMCPICPSHAELSTGSLLNHLAANHKSKNLLNCRFHECDFSTWVPYFLKYHLARVHQQLPFHCSVCPKKFNSSPTLKVHLLSHASAESKMYVCPRPNCKFSTHYQGNLGAHVQSHDLEPKHKCLQCGWKTKHKNNIAQHVRRIHGNTIKQKPFKCPQDKCNFRTESLGNLKSHSRFHLNYKPFKCQICKFSTKYKNNLKAHLGVHSELKPFECHLCRRKIRTSQALQDHLRRHLGEKPCKCPESECGFVAATRSQIKMHVYWRHSNKKNFKCPLCEKAFKTKYSLAAHALTHTLERPFSCSFCSRGSQTNSSKKEHEKRCRKRPGGLQIKPFKCTFCEKWFCSTGQKSTHEMTCKSRPDGRKIRPYKCHANGCRFASTTKSGLNQHLNRLHH